MKRIILASASPRRKMLMEQACIPCEIIPSDVDEKTDDEISPYEAVKVISSKKAMHIMKKLASSDEEIIIIAADTVVSLSGKILGKPANEDDAFNTLKKLSGRVHHVYTGVTIVDKKADGFEVKYIVDNANVYMRKLTDEEIWAYVKSGEPFNKAGSYAIQEKGSLLVEKIEGDYYTIVGLPLVKVYLALQTFGIELTQRWA